MTHHGRRLFLKAMLAGLAGARRLRAVPQPATARLQFLPGGGASLLWVVTESGTGSVSWHTGAAEPMSVELAVRPLPPDLTGLDTPLQLLLAHLPDLPADADIAYTLQWNGAPAGDGLFHTPGPHGPAITFLALGDSGTTMPQQYAIAAAMDQERDAAFVLHVGDMAYPAGSFTDLREAYLKPYAAQMARIPFYACPGNHEYYTDVLRPYMRLRVGPDDTWSYYSVQHGPVHVIAVDSNDPVQPDPAANRMLQWLEHQLSGSTSFWRVVIFHHPPYTAGLHQGDPFVQLARQRLAPLVERYAVPLVLNGHEHLYQRTCPVKDGLPAPSGAGTTYVTTGGGGASLYPFNLHPLTAFGQSTYEFVKVHIDGLRMSVTALDANGLEFDGVEIAPRPALRDVVNAADRRPVLAPGSLAVVRGFHFPPDWPARLRCDGQPVDVIESSAVSLQFQVPATAGSVLRLEVETPNGVAETEAAVDPVAPALFPWDPAHLLAPRAAAAVFATGLGALNGDIPAAALELSVGPVLQPATAVPTAMPGVFRIGFTVPPVKGRTIAIRLSAAGQWSAPVFAPVSRAQSA